MAGRPLRPDTDRRLGEPLPHLLANPISATPKARGLARPPVPPAGIWGSRVGLGALSRPSGYVPIYYSPVRH